jgi:hypothetical protein
MKERIWSWSIYEFDVNDNKVLGQDEERVSYFFYSYNGLNDVYYDDTPLYREVGRRFKSK